MKPYRDIDNDSGVVAFDARPGSITVRFEDGMCYEYTDSSAGSHHVHEMQRLAEAGDGLNRYINKYVRKGYARRFRC